MASFNSAYSCNVSVIYSMFQPFPDEWYTQERVDLFRRMVKDADALDKASGQPDCVDPEKAKVAKHIDELEEQFCEYKGADHD